MFGTNLMLGCAAAACSSACCTAQPVASATWTTRRWLWPPSRVRCQRSDSPGVKGTPSSASRSIAAGAFSTTNSTARRSLRPAPAPIVSSIWLSNVSPGSSTAAIPPWAHAVDPALISPLARTATLRSEARLSAALSPAAPEPSTTTSKARSAMLAAGAGKVEEHVLEVGFAGRNVDDPEALALERGEHFAGIHPVLAVGDGEGSLSGQLDLVEAGRLRRCLDVAVDDDLDHLFL